MFYDDCIEAKCIGFERCNSLAKGRVVEEYSFSDGSKGIIMDSFYINKSSDELEELDKNYQRIVWSIVLENLKTDRVFKYT